MSIHLMCLTSNGGLPLLTRKKGETELLPFSTVASLNGVHMFGKSQAIALKSVCSEETTLVWKEFEDSIVLICAATGANEFLLNHLLDSIFKSMVFSIGLEELKSSRNPDILKRELRICYPLLDKLLECIDLGDKSSTKVDLLNMSQAILCSENHLFQHYLDSFVELVDTIYGFLLIHGRISIATSSWWNLHVDERKLLSFAALSDPVASVLDVPFFLPCQNPTIPVRLVACTLTPGIRVCVILGPTPSLTDIENAATHCWKSAIDLLRTAEQCYPRDFPLTTSLDDGVLGFLLINNEVNKFVLSRNSPFESSIRKEMRSSSSVHRLDVLRTFYHQISSTFLDNEQNAIETYWCSEYHKCHCLKENSNLICVLYTSAIPLQTMRFITKKTLKSIIQDKQVSW